MHLYKYLRSSRVDVLKDKIFVYSKPTRFNDPFDCLPHYKESLELNPIGARIYFLKMDFNDFDSARLHAEVINHVKLSVAADPSFTLVAVMPIDPSIPPEHHGDFVSGFRTSIAPSMQDSVVALSLSEEANSLLMWAHYAEDHTGFVVGFCSDHTYFNSAGVNPSNPGYLNKVVYSSDRPSGVVGTMSAESAYLTKGLEWSYEREWRVLQKARNASRVIENSSGDIHLFEYPSDAVVQVVVGARAKKETLDTIRDILSDRAVWPNVSLYQAVVDSRHYRLNYEPISI